MESKRLNGLRILAICVLASVAYGILHDLLSTQVCLEYFTVHHPKIVESSNPFVLAFVWGVMATWWVGLILGIGLAAVACLGDRPIFPASRLVRPLAKLLAMLLALAILVWLAIYAFGTFGPMIADPNRTDYLPELNRRLTASALAHLASYMGGAVVFGILGTWIYWERRRLMR